MVLSPFVWSQNLIPNGDFEDYTTLPSTNGQWNYCIGWSNVNGVSSNYPYATPDYLHTQGTGIANLPNSGFATVFPQSGNAIMGFITYSEDFQDFREYISTQLSSPMTPGVKYNIALWITSGEGDYAGGYSSDNISIQFSQSPLTQATHEPIGGNPHLEIIGEVWETNWQHYSFSFIADAPYSYITIGNFKTDVLTSVTKHVQTPFKDAYYFIDNISVIEDTSLQIIGNTEICLGDSTTLTAIHGSSYIWFNSSDPSVILSTDSTITVSPTLNTTYTVYSQTDSASIEVIVNSPVVSYADTTKCEAPLVLYNNDPNGTYIWPDSTMSADFTFYEPGNYIIGLEENGCLTYDTLHIIQIDCNVTLDMPNVFTPNNDGTNDLFTPIYINNIESMETTILNRWGNVVFKTDDPLINWDGGNCSEGTYFWVVQYTTRTGIKLNISGFLTLFK